MVDDLQTLKERYPSIVDYHSLGKTDYDRDVWAVKLGNGDRTIFLNGSHHAREWMTTQVLMKMIDTYANAYQNDSLVGKYSAYDLLNEYTIWFIPMVNPDGVTLQQQGLSAFPKEVHQQLINMNDGSRDFTRWKSNANGVDLNRQYPANWHSRTAVSRPYWHGYKGQQPFQEKETQYVRDFTYEIKPDMASSYHSSGEIIFWHFHNKYRSRDYQLVRELGAITGYSPVPPVSNPSGKGYTDWFIQEFNKPAFTPEISPYVGNRHVPPEYFSRIWDENRTVGLWMASKSENLHSDSTIPIQANIQLDKDYYLYKSPSFESRTASKLSAQVVSAHKKQGNWYLVSTSMGDRWVSISDIEEKLHEQNFIDVSNTHWARSVIDFAFENKIMVGTDDLYFSPSAPITRAQAAVVISRLFSYSTNAPANSSFSDVSESHWAYGSIEAMKHHSIMKGTHANRFNPNTPVTREEIAVILTRIFNGQASMTEEKPFPDVDPSRWSANAISYTNEKGIFRGGPNGFFNPKDPLTRAEFAALIQRIQSIDFEEATEEQGEDTNGQELNEDQDGQTTEESPDGQEEANEVEGDQSNEESPDGQEKGNEVEDEQTDEESPDGQEKGNEVEDDQSNEESSYGQEEIREEEGDQSNEESSDGQEEISEEDDQTAEEQQVDQEKVKEEI
ncbi:M14 family zinc carboxypeptidase [Desertibacillus haloalkaliphilus]|uniref:M14 family zinc carboxypeptidase n=1 Tax=Desertibacillus haloalkaliphilus TaxID=1328930 RepID=UPI002484A9EB|nr:M14 family zinc carboxypeptidase [Desertibacillus haloalkaliphilus]MBU8906529.1 S-layer homology domain-containing protein [Desertibacillus haloalkaliphilus]